MTPSGTTVLGSSSFIIAPVTPAPTNDIIINSITVPSAAASGTPATFSVSAASKRGDALKYKWTVDSVCGGFTDSTLASVTYNPSAMGIDSMCTAAVMISNSSKETITLTRYFSLSKAASETIAITGVNLPAVLPASVPFQIDLTVSYAGTGTLSYIWSAEGGQCGTFSADNIEDPVFTPAGAINTGCVIKVDVTASTGAKESKSLPVVVYKDQYNLTGLILPASADYVDRPVFAATLDNASIVTQPKYLWDALPACGTFSDTAAKMPTFFPANTGAPVVCDVTLTVFNDYESKSITGSFNLVPLVETLTNLRINIPEHVYVLPPSRFSLFFNYHGAGVLNYSWNLLTPECGTLTPVDDSNVATFSAANVVSDTNCQVSATVSSTTGLTVSATAQFVLEK